jgi:hypothetical protein
MTAGASILSRYVELRRKLRKLRVYLPAGFRYENFNLTINCVSWTSGAGLRWQARARVCGRDCS